MTVTSPQTTDRRRARSEKTRLKLLDAAITCYKRNGVAATGMEEVAQQAGVGRATLYRHFSNQKSLLSEVMAHNMREIKEVINATLQNCETAEDLYVEAALIILKESQDRGLTELLFGTDSLGRAADQISFNDPAIRALGEEILAPFVNRARSEGILRDWVTKPLLQEWTSRLMLSFIANPSDKLNSTARLRKFFHQAVMPSIVERR